jgi:hypothetical protein
MIGRDNEQPTARRDVDPVPARRRGRHRIRLMHPQRQDLLQPRLSH